MLCCRVWWVFGAGASSEARFLFGFRIFDKLDDVRRLINLVFMTYLLLYLLCNEYVLFVGERMMLLSWMCYSIDTHAHTDTQTHTQAHTHTAMIYFH